MGPKKKNKKPPPFILDGVDTSEMTREKLEIYLLKVKEELDREREERNYFQLERDKIRTFWEITCYQLDEVKADIRNRERVSEEIQEENAALLEFEKQKIKHLKYEQQCALAALRSDNLVSLKAAKEEYAAQEQELLQDKRSIRIEMREKTLAAQDEFRREKLKHAEHMSETRAIFEEKAMEIEDKADKKLIETKLELAERQKKEITEAEDRKNKQIAEIIDKHELAFSELKNYYNDITLNNLGLICSLKIQMEDVQRAKERSEKLARDAVAEVKRIREPLEKLMNDNKDLKQQLTNYEKDKAALKLKTRQVAILEKQLDVLKWEYEVLLIRFDKILAERDELMTRFMRAVLEVQQRTSLKTALLEAKIINIKGKDIGPRELQIEINRGPQNLQELFKLKDTQVEDLRYEAARIRKAHDDLLATYEAKLFKLGVPPDELGFKPLKAAAVAALCPITGEGPIMDEVNDNLIDIMPPKKAGSKKAPAIIIDGVDTSEMSREKLEQFTLKVKEELDREREERNYFQLERDKIRTFWEITRQQLEETKAEVRNKERAAEETQEENDAILEFEKQKIKHLKYEQQAALAALRAENLVALKAAKEEHAEQELELLNDKRALRQDVREKMLAAQDELRRAKLVHAEELSKTRTAFEKQAIEIEDKAEKKLVETKIELAVRHRTEVAEVEERKNKQISELIDHHEIAFAELKNYYNDITLNNLGLIASLKLQMEEMLKAKERSDKIARDATAEAKRLREPLEAAILDNKELNRQMANYERDKASLRAKTKQLAVIEKQYEVLKWEYEVIQVRFDRMQKERDELKARFTRAVMEVQQRASLKTALLEAKLNNMQGKDLGPRELQELLKVKDTQVEDLRYEAARLRKAHDDLLATYEAKLAKLGIPLEELGFKPLKAVAVAGMTPIIGQGPANLVTKDQ